MQTILDWYVWMPLETEAFVWPGAIVSRRRPEARAQREHLCLTSVDLVRVKDTNTGSGTTGGWDGSHSALWVCDSTAIPVTPVHAQKDVRAISL